MLLQILGVTLGTLWLLLTKLNDFELVSAILTAIFKNRHNFSNARLVQMRLTLPALKSVQRPSIQRLEVHLRWVNHINVITCQVKTAPSPQVDPLAAVDSKPVRQFTIVVDVEDGDVRIFAWFQGALPVL